LSISPENQDDLLSNYTIFGVLIYKAMRILLLTITLLTVALSSCSKYDEGKPSLASKKSRIVNNWAVVKITANGFDITSAKIITSVDVRSNNTLTVNGELFGTPYSNVGGWAFNSNKTHVLVTNNDGSVDSYEIIKLEKDSMKLRIVNGDGVTIEYEFKTA